MRILVISRFAVVIFVLAAMLFSAGCVSEAPLDTGVTYYTEQYPPYNYLENGTLRGVAVDLLVETTGRMGSPVSTDAIHVLPWADAYGAALERNNTALFSTVRLPEREKLFKWAGPIVTEHKVLFARSGSGISINDATDLTGYRIGVVTDDAALGELTALGVDPRSVVAYPDPSAVLTMLLEKKIDLFAYGRDAGEYVMKDTTGSVSGIIVVYELRGYELYYAFSPDTPDTTVAAFQKALDGVKNNPDRTGVTEYQRILYRNIETGCAEQTVPAYEVMELVNRTARDIENDAAGTFELITAQKPPYYDPDNPAKYVFVYNTGVTIVADGGNAAYKGLNMSGKTDVAGAPFRDQIVAGALRQGTGWVDYIFVNPAESGLFEKTTYFTLVKGSDGDIYVVCSGTYKPCN